MKYPLAFFIAMAGLAPAQDGPFDPAAWPPIVQLDATVHYTVVNDAIAPPAGAANWQPTLQILSGGDQQTEPISIGGFAGVKATSNYVNFADLNQNYTEWADDDLIDILVQVYGDAAVLNAQGQPRNFNFLIGTLPGSELSAPVGGQLPVEAKNSKWSWVLFRIANGARPSDGLRFLGSLPPNSQGGNQNGGVNGGTIRMEGVPDLIVRAVAFGPVGAFGEPEQINRFAPPDACAEEPITNLVWADINAGTNDHLQVLTGGDQVSVIESDIGPVGDRRRAVRPDGLYLNFGITDNFLGLPCNDPRSIKICIQFYDDPAGTGRVFGPEAYATDAQAGVGFVPAGQRHTLEGSGRWIERAWVVPSVNLRGVNTVPLTGGVRLLAEGGPVHVSRVDLAVLRTGTHPLAGQDPLAECPLDPNVCEGVYGDYAEMDLVSGLMNGLQPGTSGGDQEMIQEEGGPLNDRRMGFRAALDDGTPGSAHQYINFAILEERLGPSSQPNARLAICATYYDDPALTGQSFRPEVYQTDRGGTTTFAFTGANVAVTLLGTDRWQDAYFELPDVKFSGVNQGPQAAARFVASGKVLITRLRYAVIRPCGPTEGQNLLETCKPLLEASTVAGGLRLAWIAGHNWNLEASDALAIGGWLAVPDVPLVENGQNVVVLPISDPRQRHFRLRKP